MRHVLVVGTLLVLLALVMLFNAVHADGGGRPSTSIVRVRERVVIPFVATAAATQDAVLAVTSPGTEPVLESVAAETAAAPSGTLRPWSAQSVALALGAGEARGVRGVRLDGYDPATPGEPPNPFAPPKPALTAEDTRVGLDR